MKRWYKYIRPYLAYFIIGPVCMIVEVLGEIVMPKLLACIIDYGAQGGAKPPFIEWFYQLFGADAPFILAIMAGMILTAVLMMLGGIGGAYFGAKAAVNFAADLREDVYGKVQQFSFSNIDKFSTGSLVTRLTNDVTQLQNFINMMLRMALRAPGMLIGALIMAVVLNPSLTLVLCVALPLLLLTISFFIMKGFPRFSKMQEKIDHLNSTVQENITNVRVVKSFVREDREREKFRAANGKLKSAGMNAMMIIILMSPAMTFFMNATTIAVLWFGGNMVVDGGMSTGDLTAFVTYITQILMSLMMLTMVFMMFSRAMASARRIAEVLDEPIDIADDHVEDRSLTIRQGKVEFRNVSFRYYKNSEREVLDHINLTIEPGSITGILGSTGSGKTSLVSMIPRLYDCDEGEVLVDGVNVKDYTLFHLREGVGMVLQKNVLFSGTIEENLRWGNPDASEEEIQHMAALAQADKFVNTFTDGYQTDLEQGGTNVSGGQKQRLCIARALLKKPKILILDDSTSAVDTATETMIRKSLREDLSDSTKIIIAQRISSVIEADQIVVMDEGCITGIGTHEELLASNQTYQEIYYSQMDKKEA
ncbi:MAG: ABC transporter ATP-binding protein [Clostridiales bacterium]|nr:ABC transporter ATP-binding protein [Clostridiales bacterium]